MGGTGIGSVARAAVSAGMLSHGAFEAPKLLEKQMRRARDSAGVWRG